MRGGRSRGGLGIHIQSCFFYLIVTNFRIERNPLSCEGRDRLTYSLFTRSDSAYPTIPWNDLSGRLLLTESNFPLVELVDQHGDQGLIRDSLFNSLRLDFSQIAFGHTDIDPRLCPHCCPIAIPSLLLMRLPRAFLASTFPYAVLLKFTAPYGSGRRKTPPARHSIHGRLT